MTNGKKKSGLVKVAVSALALVAALAAIEVALRVVGFNFHLYPATIEFGYPNPKEMASDFVPHDRLLWVDGEYADKVAAAKRDHPALVLMGCSCTAWGRYDEALAKRIEDRRAGAQLDFVNLAFPGWSSFQGREQMRADVREMQPKVVTIYYGWNDHWIGFGVDDATAADLNESWLYPLQSLRTVQLVNKALVSREAGEGKEPGKPKRVAPADFRANLVEIVETARSIGATPVLLTAPTAHRKGAEPKYLAKRWLERLEDLVPLHQRYVSIVRDVARETGTPLCDLAEAARALPPKQRGALFKPDGIHFLPAGSEFVAEALYRCLEEEGLLDVLVGSS